MRKLILFGVFTLILMPVSVLGFATSQVTNHQVPASYIYPQQFDVLVLDLTIPSGVSESGDVLKAIVLQNAGTAHNLSEISKVILWQDAGETGFQGLGIDEVLGEMIFYADNNSWYLKDLNVAVPAQGLRIFASAETVRLPNSDTTLRMQVPVLQDQNLAGLYDPGDLGIFLESKNNGPADGAVTNNEIQTIRRFVVDNLPPKTVITNLDESAAVTTTDYLIKGMARDQGGSSLQWVRIGINPSTDSGQADNWYDAQGTGENYYTWEYNWQNIGQGVYAVQVRAADWLDNTGTSGGITVTAAKEEVIEPPAEGEEEEVPAEEEEEAVPEKSIGEMTMAELQEKIREILDKINQLKAQLAEIQSQKAVFQNNLKYGDRGEDVEKLQEVLIREGLLGQGLNTGWFGPLTRTAVIEFQQKYAAEILTPAGLSSGTGFVGEKTRAKLNELYED